MYCRVISGVNGLRTLRKQKFRCSSVNCLSFCLGSFTRVLQTCPHRVPARWHETASTGVVPCHAANNASAFLVSAGSRCCSPCWRLNSFCTSPTTRFKHSSPVFGLSLHGYSAAYALKKAARSPLRGNLLEFALPRVTAFTTA